MSPLADRILFMDGEAIVLDKPAGLPVDRPRDGSLSLENHLGSLTFGFQRWPLAVHRLDRDTSGCLLLARNPKAHKRFAAAFEAGEVKKTYIAAIAGIPAEQEGVIDMPLAKISSPDKGWRMVASAKGKSALTRWRLIGTHEGRALIACFPETGRTHQIRVHLADGLGFGIIGDPVYGTPPLVPGTPMLLHARAISVPRGNKPPVEGKAPLPDRFAAAGFTEATLADAGL
ncbi:MAG: RNA pseudouridine synthase [Sphingomonadales bacterium]|nr:MAG: RNA pseudouridine synthase [Sphingomonadales bacterium]